MCKINKKQHILLFIFFWPISFYTVPANVPAIHTIYSLAQAQKELNSTNQNTLVVFDMDDTLIEQSDMVFQTRFFKHPEVQKLRQELKKHTAQLSDPVKAHELVATTRLLKNSWHLVEKKSLPIIKKLQEHNIRVIALTAVPTGSFGIIRNMQEWRFAQLKNLGLDFSTSFTTQEIVFNELAPFTGLLTSPAYPTKHKKYPMYYKGIICSRPHPKGTVLATFLKHIDWTPKKVLFFDDTPKHVKSVTQAMKNLGIACSGYVYKGASVPTEKFNAQIAKKQYDIFTQKAMHVLQTQT